MLNQDFREFIESLKNNGGRYLVVGGYAVALHGYPRYTKDLAIWIDSTTENAEKIWLFGNLRGKVPDLGVRARSARSHPQIWGSVTTIPREPKIFNALIDFGMGSLGLKANDFLEEDTIIQIGFPPNRIDIITSLPGVDFEECYREKIDVELDGILVHFISLENLKKNKLASGRPQDLADLDNL